MNYTCMLEHYLIARTHIWLSSTKCHWKILSNNWSHLRVYYTSFDIIHHLIVNLLYNSDYTTCVIIIMHGSSVVPENLLML